MPRTSPRETVRLLLADACAAAATAGDIGGVPPAISVERPKNPAHGDFATNVALALAKAVGKPPRVVAEALVKQLPVGGGALLSEVAVAGPGFINLRLDDRYWQAVLPEILAAGGDWGRRTP